MLDSLYQSNAGLLPHVPLFWTTYRVNRFLFPCSLHTWTSIEDLLTLRRLAVINILHLGSREVSALVQAMPSTRARKAFPHVRIRDDYTKTHVCTLAFCISEDASKKKNQLCLSSLAKSCIHFCNRQEHIWTSSLRVKQVRNRSFENKKGYTFQ